MQQSGVILLTICVFDMPSYTHAVKGQRLLRARGVPCALKRRERSLARGCGYSVHVYGSGAEAAELLEAYRIPFSVRNSGGEDDDKL